MATYFIMLGPPGVGKGTQAKVLSEKTSLPHISSGQLFRENIKNQTELGKLAKSYMDKGELVPDDVTIGMLRERLSRPNCERGAILDGFPRTPAQADVLEQLLAGIRGGLVEVVVPYLTAPESVSVERISGRWTCRANGHVYHEKFNPPQRPGICDVDGSELYQREDDKAETVKHRIEVYLEQTAPLIEYYRQAGKLLELDGTRTVEQVTAELLSAVRK